MAAYHYSGPEKKPKSSRLRPLRVAASGKEFLCAFELSVPTGQEFQYSETYYAEDDGKSPSLPATTFTYSLRDVAIVEGGSVFRVKLGTYEGAFNDQSPPLQRTHNSVIPFLPVQGSPDAWLKLPSGYEGTDEGDPVRDIETGYFDFTWYARERSDPEDPESEEIIVTKPGRFKLVGTAEIKFTSLANAQEPTAARSPNWHTYRAIFQTLVRLSGPRMEIYDEEENEWVGATGLDYWTERPSFSHSYVTQEIYHDLPITHAFALEYPGWFNQGPA